MRVTRWFISWLRFEKCSCFRCYRAANHMGQHRFRYGMEE